MATTNVMEAGGKKGDIRVAFGFMEVPGYRLPMGAIHLFTKWNQQVVLQIPECEMWRFDYRDRDPITKNPRCLPECARLAELLYGMPTSYGAARVLDAITDWMDEIKNLPPPSTYRNTDDYLGEMRRRGFDVVEALSERIQGAR